MMYYYNGGMMFFGAIMYVLFLALIVLGIAALWKYLKK